MSAMSQTMTQTVTRRRADEIQYRLVYLATLPILLVWVAATRLVGAGPTAWGRPQSLIGEAKAAAQTCGSLSLMG